MLNIHAVIDHCCGVSNPQDFPYVEKQKLLADQFKKHKLGSIKPGSIQKWFERNQIPGEWIVNLHILAEKQGKPLALSNYIETNIEALLG